MRAEISWDLFQNYIYEFDSREVLVFSSSDMGGDRSWRWFPSQAVANQAINPSGDVTRDKGEIDLEESFVQRIRSAGGKVFLEEDDANFVKSGYLGQEQHQAEILAAMDKGRTS